MNPIRRASVVAAAAMFVSPSDAAARPGQSGVASWGKVVFDTRWHEEPFEQVVGGGGFSLARHSDGNLVAWGDNTFGTCVVPPLPPGRIWIDVAAGIEHAVGLMDDGTIAAWGDGSFGQLDVPPLPPGRTCVDIDSSARHTLALLDDGSALAWGMQDHGICEIPPLPPGASFVALSAGTYLSLGLLDDGSVLAWGWDTGLQLDVPALPVGVTYTQVDAGWFGAAALRSDGVIVCWGGMTPTPPQPPGTWFVDVSSSGTTTFGLRNDDTLVGWGSNSHGKLDVPTLASGVVYVDVEIDGIVSARRSDGLWMQWGSPTLLQGNMREPPLGTEILRATTGRDFTLALLSDGTIDAWNHLAFSNHMAAPALPAGLTYVDVRAGYLHALALRSDGSAVGWGANDKGESNVPLLPPGTTYVQVAPGGEHSLALRSDGTAVAWGALAYGQTLVPPLPAGLVYTKVSAGFQHSAALRSDGQVLAWGRNDSGQCNVPPLPSGLKYVDLDCGDFHGLALRSDGALVAWGDNSEGQCDPAPAAPPGVSYLAPSGGERHSAVRLGDGGILVWGKDEHGQHVVPALPPGSDWVQMEAARDSIVARYESCASTPVVYCTAKVTSEGCTPQIAMDGLPSASAGQACTLRTLHLPGNVLGLYLHSTSGAQAVSFHGGFLCVAPPLWRHAPSTTGGSAAACSGTLQEDLGAALSASPDPGVVAGATLWVQAWSRDPAAATGDNVSDAVTATICP